MAFNLKLYKGWDAYIEVTQAFVPGIIKTLIDGIAFISNMENVLMGEILQVAGLDIKAIVINIEEEGIKAIILKDTGKNDVTMQVKVDPSILGGFILQFGDKLYDTSINHKLDNLRKEFMVNKYVREF